MRGDLHADLELLRLGRPTGEAAAVARDNGDAIGHGQANRTRQTASYAGLTARWTRSPKIAMLDGRVRLRQPARGYRAGMDAALLAAACDAGPARG